jgi:hypothetical protein
MVGIVVLSGTPLVRRRPHLPHSARSAEVIGRRDARGAAQQGRLPRDRRSGNQINRKPVTAFPATTATRIAVGVRHVFAGVNRRWSGSAGRRWCCASLMVSVVASLG